MRNASEAYRRAYGKGYEAAKTDGTATASAAIEASVALIERVRRAEEKANAASDNTFSLLFRIKKVEEQLGDTFRREEIYDLRDALASLNESYDKTSHSVVEDEILRLSLRLAEVALPKTKTPKEGS